MSHYNVGSDHSGNGDQACIDKVCELLQKAGHTVTNLGVTPNLERKMKKGGGNIGVFIVNGLCIGTVDSCAKMADSGGCDKVIFAVPKVLYGGRVKLPEGLKTTKLNVVNDGTPWPSDVRAKSGKYTWDEFCGQYDKVDYVYGNNCDDIANAILNGTQSGSSTSGTSEDGEGSIMSGWESLTDLLKPLDGEAMIVVRGDTVIVKRIYPPQTTRLWVYEGVNIVDDSVKISDYSPEIYNTFTVNWGASFENSFDISFDKHKELFGERKTEVNAINEVPKDSTTSSGDSTTTNTNTSNSDDGGLWGFITNGLGMGGNESEELKKAEQQATTSTSGKDDEQQVEEVPITDEAEAYLFGLKQIGKARRKDGHKIDCKVIGNKNFEVGEWCRVFIPSFNEDTIMFINKVSHESAGDSEWITSLTLVDYPPSLGVGQSNVPKSSEGSDDGSSGSDIGGNTGDTTTDTGATANTDANTSGG